MHAIIKHDCSNGDIINPRYFPSIIQITNWSTDWSLHHAHDKRNGSTNLHGLNRFIWLVVLYYQELS